MRVVRVQSPKPNNLAIINSNNIRHGPAQHQKQIKNQKQSKEQIVSTAIIHNSISQKQISKNQIVSSNLIPSSQYPLRLNNYQTYNNNSRYLKSLSIQRSLKKIQKKRQSKEHNIIKKQQPPIILKNSLQILQQQMKNMNEKSHGSSLQEQLDQLEHDWEKLKQKRASNNSIKSKKYNDINNSDSGSLKKYSNQLINNSSSSIKNPSRQINFNNYNLRQNLFDQKHNIREIRRIQQTNVRLNKKLMLQIPYAKINLGDRKDLGNKQELGSNIKSNNSISNQNKNEVKKRYIKQENFYEGNDSNNREEKMNRYNGSGQKINNMIQNYKNTNSGSNKEGQGIIGMKNLNELKKKSNYFDQNKITSYKSLFHIQHKQQYLINKETPITQQKKNSYFKILPIKKLTSPSKNHNYVDSKHLHNSPIISSQNNTKSNHQNQSIYFYNRSSLPQDQIKISYPSLLTTSNTKLPYQKSKQQQNKQQIYRSLQIRPYSGFQQQVLSQFYIAQQAIKFPHQNIQ